MLPPGFSCLKWRLPPRTAACKACACWVAPPVVNATCSAAHEGPSGKNIIFEKGCMLVASRGVLILAISSCERRAVSQGTGICGRCSRQARPKPCTLMSNFAITPWDERQTLSFRTPHEPVWLCRIGWKQLSSSTGACMHSWCSSSMKVHDRCPCQSRMTPAFKQPA